MSQFPKESLKIGAVLFGEMSLIGGQVSFRVNRVLSADRGAIAAIDAFIGVDIYLRYASSGIFRGLGRDGCGRAFCDTDEVLSACISYNESHEMLLLDSGMQRD